AAYNRNKIAEDWSKKLDDLRHDDAGGYRHFVKNYENKGHWKDREDAIALPRMAKHTPTPIPQRAVWKQYTVTHDRSYGVGAAAGSAKKGTLVIATRSGQSVDIIQSQGVDKLIVRLDDRMMDLDQAVKITLGGKVSFEGIVPRTVGTLLRTLSSR